MKPESRANGLAFCRQAPRRACVVFDIDNTLVDTRHRTRAAADLFCRRHPNTTRLAGLPLRDIRYDGLQTAAARGVEPKVAKKFHSFWDRFFWRPQSFRLDRPIRQTVQLARQAKAAGAEVFYLTGRVEPLKGRTLTQLRRLGLPDADPAHVICKPSMDLSTAPFKRQVVAEIARRQPIQWFMSDSRTDIAAVQCVLPPGSCVLVDFPVGPARKPAPLHQATPVIKLRP